MNGKLILIIFFIIYTETLTAQNNWTWVNGVGGQTTLTPVYGVQGVPSINNTPGCRYGSVTWTDNSGNLWLFGGTCVSYSGFMGDLWKYNPITNEWTWINGPNTPNNLGVYGIQGVSSPSNSPGCRGELQGWVDLNGNLWMYGGVGNAAQAGGQLADLWKYNIASNQWTWVKGFTTTYSSPSYGTMGVSSPNNSPGARVDYAGCSDQLGNFWLFGGYYNSDSFNDLWKYEPATNNWTWMGGSLNCCAGRVYGQKGVASINNNPGARSNAACCSDNSGNFWVFGGGGYPGANGTWTLFNDLWKYNFASGLWTWMGGSNLPGNLGNYGTQGVTLASNSPPARWASSLNCDKLGNLWIFGGSRGSFGNTVTFNDLWRFNTTTDHFTWVKGSALTNQSGNYGVLGVASNANTPGGRYMPITWRDNSAKLWQFGGYSSFPNGSGDTFNDLWKFDFCNLPGAQTYPSPTVGLSGINSICVGQTSTITVTGANTYSWSNSLNSNSVVTSVPYQIVAPVVTTKYIATITNSIGCEGSAVITISVNPSPTITVSAPASICIGEIVTLSITGAPFYTLVSSLNTSTVISSDPHQLISPNQNVTYSISTISIYGCPGQTIFLISADACTGIINQESNYVNVYPNPCESSFKLVGLDISDVSALALYDASDKLVLSETTLAENRDIEISQLPPGLYFLKITKISGKKVITKVIKN